MELPREIQVYILSYLYDPWKKKWKKVMETLNGLEVLSRHFQLSNLVIKTWMLPKNSIRRIIQYRLCLDCGNYYQIPMYSCSVVGCDCP
jgi:hypothetical protein